VFQGGGLYGGGEAVLRIYFLSDKRDREVKQEQWPYVLRKEKRA
jgi:hypothetical protein